MNMYPAALSNNTIKTWAEEDRPREKLLLKGKASLSDAELIAILINSGTSKLSAVDLSRQILGHSDNKLSELSKLQVKDFCKFKGIGQAKAIAIVAAMELGRRRKAEEQNIKIKITSSQEAYNQLYPYLADLDHEEFWIVLLKRNLELIKTIQISVGGVAGTVVDARLIFKHAIENLASFVILAHNHPSGNTKPSEADLRLTKSLKTSGELLETTIADHIIFTNNGYYSMADEGKL